MRSKENQSHGVTGYRLSQLTGIDRRRIYEKNQSGELPSNKNGLFDLQNSLTILGILPCEEALKDNNKDLISINRMRALKEREIAFLKRIERANKEKNLIEIKKIKSIIKRLYLELFDHLFFLPKYLIEELVDETNQSSCKKILECHLRNKLYQFSNDSQFINWTI